MVFLKSGQIEAGYFILTQKMMTKFVMVLLFLTIRSPSIQSLHCYSGYDIKARLLNRYALNVKECENPNERCLAGTVTFKYLNFFDGKL